MKARKKPIVIEFYPCTIGFLEKIMKWSTKDRPITQGRTKDHKFILEITTLEGKVIGTNEDMIIKGIDGECYPCKMSIFNKTYELVQ